MSEEVTIVDYGSGNLFSVGHAIEHAGGVPVFVSDAAGIERAELLVLPGVGAFSEGMQGLRERGLVEPIRRYAESGRPLLGICLGMQMLASYSEEFGNHAGLDLIPGRVVSVPAHDVEGKMQKIPHIGWAGLMPLHPGGWHDTPFDTVVVDTSVYMVHSYQFVPYAAEHLLAEFEYGGHRIAAAVQSGRVIGCQFHPEKSGPAGIEILRAFLRLKNIQHPEIG